ncbi:F-box protein 3 [Fistulifera solaris]|uniref:F-box protein 3 n=1 Tax=Fistulifera solaris TaxID=1519565 RepID=A0A1Z5JYX6_FISSO|nr:F-box protein 3 [Fistulifera solaris]|eukprot:GAX19082.1 F-box protein 3 [Fistulifera solaris]
MTANDTPQQVMQVIADSDVWNHHLAPFLTFQDVARCEQVFRCNDKEKTWELLCVRDFSLNSKEAPDDSFQTILRDIEKWKEIYRRWRAWHVHTHHVTTTQQGYDAIQLYQDIQSFYIRQHQRNTLPKSYQESLAPALDKNTLLSWTEHALVPSDLVAWYAVCGGQHVLSRNYSDEDFWAAFLGCYTCYDAYYAMRLVDAKVMGPMGVRSQSNYPNNHVLVALCVGNPRLCLSVRKDPGDDPHGRLVRLHPFGHNDRNSIVVGDQGILHYFQEYVKQLRTGTFPIASLSPDTRRVPGFVLFPDAGDAVSVCITHGIEVRASARWFPTFSNNNIQPWQEDEEGLNFGYSFRIRMVDSSVGSICQLVSRHFEFVNGHGVVRRIDGDAVVGKQPLFFFNESQGIQSFGYHDLGPAGDEETYSNMAFTYQSQTGPTAGTTRQDTHGAYIKGFFRFVPGSIEEPKGPLFDVPFNPFPLTVPFPFY